MELANGSPDSEVFLPFSEAWKGRQEERKHKRDLFKKTWKDAIKHGSNQDKLTAIIQAMQWANPAAAIPRAAVLGLARLNFVGIATRLYPAFLTDAELKAKHFDIENAKKAKVAWDKVADMWKHLGGNPEGLKKRIIEAHDRPVFHTKKAKAREEHEKNGVDGEYSFADLEEEINTLVAEHDGVSNVGDGGASAYIAAGGAVVAAMIGQIGKAGAKKNPYADRNLDTTGMDIKPPTPEEQALIDKNIAQAQQDIANGAKLGEGDNEDMLGTKSKTLKYVAFGALGLLTLAIIIKVATKHK